MIWLVAYLSSVVGAIITVVAMTLMRREERHSLGRIGWLVLVLLSPPVGFLLFLWLGGRKISAEHERRQPVRFSSNDTPVAAQQSMSSASPIDQFCHAYDLGVATEDNRVALLSDPEELFEAFLKLVSEAKRSLHVTTFIMDDGPSTQRLVDGMCDCASRGVVVRLLCDGLGSMHLPEAQLERLRNAGGQAHRFKPLSRINRLAYFNFRNHRKLAVADGCRAIVGGANLVEYELSSSGRSSPNRVEPWIDLSVGVEGPACQRLDTVFQSDWRFVTGESLDSDRNADGSGESAATGDHSGSTLSVIPIGADGVKSVFGDLWQMGLHLAQERVWLCTPYFVPPSPAIEALRVACRRGIDVRILVPEDSDLRSVDYARQHVLLELKSLGAKVLQRPERMVHAKLGIVDSKFATVGSANFDIRSFHLNYELSLLVHDRGTIKRLATWFDDLASDCRSGIEPGNAWQRAIGTGVRVFASEL